MTARSLEEAIQESHAALGAISNGDVEPYMALYCDGDDITVGNPFGPFVRGKEAVREAGDRAASRYRDGQIVGFERVATHWQTDWRAWPRWSASGRRSAAATVPPRSASSDSLSENRWRQNGGSRCSYHALRTSLAT